MRDAPSTPNSMGTTSQTWAVSGVGAFPAASSMFVTRTLRVFTNWSAGVLT